MRTRIIASAVVFAANMVLSRSYGVAEEQLPHLGAIRMSHLHHAIFPASKADETASRMMAPERSIHPYKYSGFCGLSGVNAC
jgi:hypothetical protein